MARFSEMVDAGFAYLEERVAELEAENEQLRREKGELLMKYIEAQDLAYTRMVQSFLVAPEGVLRRAGDTEPSAKEVRT